MPLTVRKAVIKLRANPDPKDGPPIAPGFTGEATITFELDGMRFERVKIPIKLPPEAGDDVAEKSLSLVEGLRRHVDGKMRRGAGPY